MQLQRHEWKEKHGEWDLQDINGANEHTYVCIQVT